MDGKARVRGEAFVGARAPAILGVSVDGRLDVNHTVYVGGRALASREAFVGARMSACGRLH